MTTIKKTVNFLPLSNLITKTANGSMLNDSGELLVQHIIIFTINNY